MTKHYDAIVLGAGAMGSAAAYHLARAGQKTLLLEQFELDHQKGSSYGHSRITRYAYDDPAYVKLAQAAFPAWAQLEAEAGEKLYTRTGGLDFGPPDSTSVRATIDCLKQMQIPHEVWQADEAMRHFPQFHLDDDTLVLFQADTGILSASRCVLAHLRLAERHGAELRPNTPIVEIVPDASGVTVKTVAETFSAARVVITAGGWARTVLAQVGLNVPLYPERCQEIYFETAQPEQYEAERFPAFIAHVGDVYGRHVYGIASNHNSGLKVALHGGQRVSHPSEINYEPTMQEIETVLRFTQRHLPDVTTLRSARVCLYTMTPDEHFLIDKHPQFPHVVFGGGCSGHSFKFSPVIGGILADLALRGTTAHDISLFGVARFL
ncbi:MAG: N-methyl-L-tryptophan oxidase [Anaerolineae bacterium]|nr:N-methyl-L-tryptophan oxidase [Anaerolineae bacterium]